MLTWKGRMVASSAAALSAAGRGPAVVLSDIAVPLIGAGDDRRVVRRSSGTLVANCCVDTVPAARLVWLVPAGVRIRQWPAQLASRAWAALDPAE
jgi:hypothetical protein